MKSYILVLFGLCAVVAQEESGASLRHLCRYGISTPYCYSNPCTNADCPAYPGANCKPDYCTCRAEFWYYGQKLTKSQCRVQRRCPDGSNPVKCLVSPCSTASCPRFPRAECRDNYCGGCNADFWHNGRKLSSYQCEKVNCPNGERYHSCFVSPCETATCPRYPSAICEDSFCGGCHAVFRYYGRKLTEQECRKGHCAYGQSAVNCYNNPCDTASCPRYPNAICRASYCGGCKAEFWHHGRKLEDSECSYGTTCPNGEQPVQCFARPCDVNTCPAHPTAVCQDDYCGGCHARYFLHGRELKKHECKRSLCSGGRHPTNCYVRPCEGKKCPKFPYANCVDNYCTCEADFYYLGRKLSEYECRKDDLKLCRYIRDSTLQLCPDICSKYYGCSDDKECCSNGFCNECQKKYTDDYRCPPADDIGICINDCNTSDDCGYNKICCSNGCGRVCKKLSSLATCRFTKHESSYCRDKCGDNWGCYYGETCCYNGRCHVCEKDPYQDLDRCKAYDDSYDSGYFCKNDCTKYSGCGALEKCCFNGKCNKCELKGNVGPGLPSCKASVSSAQLSFSLCTDICTLDSECYNGERCCWDGYCKKCEKKDHGGGLPSCVASAGTRHALSSYVCSDDCSHDYQCERGERCCFDGFCKKCEGKNTGGGGGGGSGVDNCPSYHSRIPFISCEDECSRYRSCSSYNEECCFDGWCNICIRQYFTVG